MSKRKKKKNSPLKIFAVVFGVILIVGLCILAACSGKDTPDGESHPTTQAPEATESIAEEAEDSYFPEIAELKLIWGDSYTVEAIGYEIWESSDSSIATVENGVITAKRTGSCTVFASDGDQTKQITVYISPLIELNEGVTYVNGILIANKTYGLPDDFGSDNDTAWAAFNEMAAAAQEEGLNIYASSVYRDYYTQKAIYDREYNEYGLEYVEGSTARPGHSEHQTGLAFDLNTITLDFKDTAEGKWVAEHSHEFGFILRYPEGKEHITGYMFEPWHFRYIGDEATAVYESGLTLEEYLGIDSKYES